jgi:hypothetical protein
MLLRLAIASEVTGPVSALHHFVLRRARDDPAVCELFQL